MKIINLEEKTNVRSFYEKNQIEEEPVYEEEKSRRSR